MADMKASVLLTLKDQLTGKAKQAEAALKGLGASLKGASGASGMGAAAAAADKLAGATTRAATASREIANPWSGIGRSASAAAASINQVTAATEKAAAAQRGMNARGWASTYAGWRAENKEHDRQVRRDAAKGEGGSTILGGGGGKGGFVDKAITGFIGYQIAKGVVHGADGVVSRAGDVSAMREKLKWSLGGDKAGADAAYDKAKQLSAKYGNTTVLENMHIIDDLRANLPESFDHILKDIADPFVRMHGFFKAWEGGKHAGKAEHALKEIGAAIRAGELTGAMTGELLAQHTKALATAKIVFGEKFKVGEYFQATQKSATALSAANDTFKYVDFPVLVQRLGQGGGVSLATAFQKLVAGTRVSQGTAEAWRELGLVDMSQVELSKNGKIKAGSIVGKRWLKDGDAYGINLTDAVMTKLVPALATKGGVAGLKDLDKSWKEGNVEKLAHQLEGFRKDPAAMTQLARKLGALGYDRNATKALEELILGAPSLMRDRQRALGVQGDIEKFESYDKSKQELAASADRLLQEVSGGDLSANVGKALGGLTKDLNGIAAAVARAKAGMDKGGLLGGALGGIRGTADWLAGDKDDKGKRDWGLIGKAWDWIKGSVIGGDMSAAGTSGGYDPTRKSVAGTMLGGPDWGWRGAVAAGGLAAAAGAYDPATAAAAQMQNAQGIAGSDMPATAGAEAAPSIMGAATAPITIQAQGPQVTFNQAPPSISISVTVNATTNASPDAIGQAVASHVSNAVSGGLHDGGY